MLTAEGEKKAYTLQSEGVKIQLINESEGHLIQVQNEAKANKEKIRLEAEVRFFFFACSSFAYLRACLFACLPEVSSQLGKYGKFIGKFMVSNCDNSTSNVRTLAPTPTKAYREPSGKGDPHCPHGEVCVARPQIGV